MTRSKNRRRNVTYYQRFSTDELLLQLSDWMTLVRMFGESERYLEQINHIKRILRARVNQNRNL